MTSGIGVPRSLILPWNEKFPIFYSTTSWIFSVSSAKAALTGGNFYLCLVGGKLMLPPPAIVVSETISVWEFGYEIDCVLVACGEWNYILFPKQ